MVGYLKFKNIMYCKGCQDVVCFKMFFKLFKEIIVVVKMGDLDLDFNLCLCLVVQNVKVQFMLKDNIQCVINKFQLGDGDNYEEICYEGYGLVGVVVVVEVLIDNCNWFVLNICFYFIKCGGLLGEIGLVLFMFDCVGEIVYKLDVGEVDVVLEVVIEVGVEDVQFDDGGYMIYIVFEDFNEVVKVLEEVLGEVVFIKIIWKLQNLIFVDVDKVQILMKLIDMLEDDDDVQNVYLNFDVDEDMMVQLVF